MNQASASQIRPQTGSDTVRRAVLLPFVGAGVLLGAALGHALAFHIGGRSIPSVWPPAGLVLAALLLSPPRGWAACLAVAGVSQLFSDVLLFDTPLATSLVTTAAGILEAALGAWALRRGGGAPFELRRMKEVVALGVLAGGVATMTAALIAAAVADGGSYTSAWQAWWVSHGLGVVMFAPVVLTWASPHAEDFEGSPSRRVVEAALLVAGLIVITQLVFGAIFPAALRVPVFVLPFLLWAGMRFGPRGGAACVVFVGLIGVWNTAHSLGPYAGLSMMPSEHLLRVQSSLGLITLCVLLLAAAVAERQQATEEKTVLIGELRQAIAEIKTLQGLIPMCAWCKKIRDDQDYWHTVEDYIAVHTGARFSHGMCPECHAKVSREMDLHDA